MAVIGDFLAPEDREAYKRARGEEPDTQLDHLRDDIPDWMDDFKVMQHTRYTTKPPAMADLLAMNVFNKKSAGAEMRRFGANLDVHYLKSDGTFNTAKWKQDNFVIELERAYYDNRGQVPLQWFMDNSEDLALLGGEFAEASKNLHRLSLIQASRADTKATELAEFNRDIDFISEWQQTGRNAAIMGWTNFENIYNSFGKDDARGQEALDEIAPGLSYAELRQMYEPIPAVDTPIKAGYVYEQDEKVIIYAPDGAVGSITRKKGDVAGEGEFRPGKPRQRSYVDLSGRRSDKKFADAHMELVGEAMGWVASGVAATVDKFGNLSSEIGISHTLHDIGRWLDDGDYVQGKREAVAQMESQIGLTQDQFTLMAGYDGAMEMWEVLPQVDPKSYDGIVAMAGGDLTLAQDMFVDEMLFAQQNKEAVAQQQKIYNDQLKYQINELENENFTTSQAIMAIISAWGEAMEFAATSVTVGVASMFRDETNGFWTPEFWQEVADSKTPAGVLGLDGTLMGLGLDLAATAAVDPTTYLFGPKLARSGRWGARSLDDAIRYTNNPAADLIRRQGVEVARSTSRNGIGYSALLDDMVSTGMDEVYIAGQRGHNLPLTTNRSYMDDVAVAKTTNDVTYTLLQDLFDMDLISPDDVQKAADNIKKNNDVAHAVEITANPSTGKVAITKNGETGMAIQMLNHDAIPVRIKIDEDFGLKMSRDIADWEKHIGVEDGMVPTSKLEELMRYDFRGKEIDTPEGTMVDYGTDAQSALVDDIAIEGVKKPIAVAVDPDTGAMTVINGNHRLSAALDAGVTEVPVTVSFKKGLADVPGVEGRAKPKKPVVGDDLPQIADPDLMDAEWAQGLKVGGDDVVKTKDGIFINPRRAIGDAIYGDVDWDHLKYLEREHILRGGDPIQGQKTAMSASLGKYFGDRMRNSSNKAVDWVNNFMNPINSNIRFEWTGTMAKNTVNQLGVRLWTAVDDMASWSLYQDRITHFWRNRGFKQLEANRLSAEYARVSGILEGMSDVVGGGVDNWVQRINLDGPSAKHAAAHHASVLEDMVPLRKQLDDIRAQQTKVLGELSSYKGLNDLMEEMFTEYNKKHIATHESWKDFVNDDGIVPWEEISGGRQGTSLGRMEKIIQRAKELNISIEEAAKGELGIIPEDVAALMDKVDKVGMDINTFMDDALQALQNPSSFVAPASPLEMMTAGTGGRNAAMRVRAHQAADTAMEFARKGQMYWSLDKVVTPRTAIVVSADEVVRIGHLGGNMSYIKYLEDKAMHLAETIGKLKQTRAYDKMPQRWKDRLVKLQEYPTFYRQLERSFLETNGVGFDNIKLKKVGDNQVYYNAAQRFTGGLLNDEGFRMSLKGKDEFVRWFDTDTKAARLRNMEFVDADGTTKTGLTAEQAWGYYDRMLNEYALSNIRKGKLGEARQIWKDAAERQAAKGGTAGGPVTLPDWVLEGYGQVTGNAMVSERGMGIVNKATDALFQRPVDYRRGFLAEWVRHSERARLGKLYASQGRKVISDADVHQMLKRKNPGLSDEAIRLQAPHLKQQLVERHGMITEQFVNELIEQKVISEMENTLYSFQMNSRGGKAARAVAPFGKPWADMWGFWGREMLSRPALRGWVHDANFMNMNNIANKMVDQLPFNPKSAAFVSRIAATDFNLDRIGEDPIVGGLFARAGIEGLDVGPALFLPHEGENPFGVMFPGLGIVPVGGLQAVFNHLAPDPVDNPVEYQAWVDEWSQFIPGIGYNTADNIGQLLTNAVLGGGVTSKAVDTWENLNALALEDAPTQGILNGSWAGRTQANRQVKVIFQDVDIWEEFADLPDTMTDVGLSAWLDEKLASTVGEAQDAQAKQNLGELGIEYMIPSRVDYTAANDQLDSVWIDSAAWMDKQIPKHIDMNTATGKRQAADWARSTFFDLPDWERDALVAEHPGMAVNLVSMWEWTDKAKNMRRMARTTGTPYRSGGSSNDLARHQTYQQMGLIQPVTPATMAQNIIGTIVNAKVQNARQLYTEAASQVNNQRWEHIVPDEWKEWFDYTANVLNEQGELPYKDGRTLWQNVNDLKTVHDKLTGLDEEGNSTFKFPQKYRAWGELMPSDSEGLREEFENGYPLPKMTPKLARMMRAAGITTSTPVGGEREFEMAEIYQTVANTMADEYLDNPIYAHVAPGYKAWNAPRSAGAQATQEYFGRVLDHSSFDPDTVWMHKKLLIYIDETMNRRGAGDKSWLSMREKAVDMFGTMMQDDAFRNANAKQLWDQAYGKSLGAYDWEAHEPAPLVTDEEINPDASRVYVRTVVDGDTIDFVTGTGFGGAADTYRLRVLGYNADELGEGGETQRDELEAKIREANAAGEPIYVVRDPRYGDTDMFGRVFGWLYIGDEVWYDPDTMIPRSD